MDFYNSGIQPPQRLTTLCANRTVWILLIFFFPSPISLSLSLSLSLSRCIYFSVGMCTTYLCPSGMTHIANYTSTFCVSANCTESECCTTGFTLVTFPYVCFFTTLTNFIYTLAFILSFNRLVVFHYLSFHFPFYFWIVNSSGVLELYMFNIWWSTFC